MRHFLILPFSYEKNESEGIKYCEAEKVENGIGYFKEDSNQNPLEFHCKTINTFFRVGNIMVENCCKCLL